MAFGRLVNRFRFANEIIQISAWVSVLEFGVTLVDCAIERNVLSHKSKMIVCRRAEIDIEWRGLDEAQMQRIQKHKLDGRLCLRVNDLYILLCRRLQLSFVEANKARAVGCVGKFEFLFLDGFMHEEGHELIRLSSVLQVFA